VDERASVVVNISSFFMFLVSRRGVYRESSRATSTGLAPVVPLIVSIAPPARVVRGAPHPVAEVTGARRGPDLALPAQSIEQVARGDGFHAQLFSPFQSWEGRVQVRTCRRRSRHERESEGGDDGGPHWLLANLTRKKRMTIAMTPMKIGQRRWPKSCTIGIYQLQLWLATAPVK